MYHLTLEQYLNVASALLAFLAAVFWLKSAAVKLPKRPVRTSGYVVGDFLAGGGSKDIDEMVAGLRNQSRWSAIAALFAAAAAIIQVTSVSMALIS